MENKEQKSIAVACLNYASVTNWIHSRPIVKNDPNIETARAIAYIADPVNHGDVYDSDYEDEFEGDEHTLVKYAKKLSQEQLAEVTQFCNESKKKIEEDETIIEEEGVSEVSTTA